MKTITIYHATDTTIHEFNLDHLYGGEHNFGPGIYFSTKSNNIDFYLNEYPNGKIYKVEIEHSHMVQYHEFLTKEMTQLFLDSLPREFYLSKKKYFDEKYKNKNYLYIFDNLPYEVRYYENKSEFYLKDFLLKMGDKTGVHSMFMQNGTFRNEVVVFYPKTISNVEII